MVDCQNSSALNCQEDWSESYTSMNQGFKPLSFLVPIQFLGSSEEKLSKYENTSLLIIDLIRTASIIDVVLLLQGEI